MSNFAGGFAIGMGLAAMGEAQQDEMKKELAALKAENEELRRSRDSWKRDAEIYAQNRDFQKQMTDEARAENARLRSELELVTSPHESVGAIMRDKDATIARLREALAAIKRHQEIVAGSSVQGMSVTHKIATDALDGVGAPAGIFLTLEQAREIEWAGDDDPAGQSATCIVCKQPEWASGTRHGCHAPDCWLGTKIRQAEEGHGTS